MIDATTAGALFGAMLVLAGLGWAFMSPLRDDAKDVRREPRSIIAGKGDAQRAKAQKVKRRYRNWALLVSTLFLATAVPVVLIVSEVKFSEPFEWQKVVLVFVWLGYGVAAGRLWLSCRDIDTDW